MSENHINETLNHAGSHEDDSVTISSILDGEQEVDGGDADASGTSTLTLNETGDGLEYSLTVTGLDFAANGLVEGDAVTEDTGDDVSLIHIHNAPRGENGDVVFSLFDSLGEDDLGIPGSQDEDLTVTANDDGSVTLTGVWEETDPTNTPLSEFVDEIKSGAEDEDLDLYWNVHTEEFPAGAIRGQLVVEHEEDTSPEPEPEPEPEPITVTVTIENLAPEGGTFLTPFWVGFHDGDFDTYDRGRPISPGLASLIEDGEIAPFSEEFLASGDGTIDGAIAGENGIAGPIDPGETVTATFEIDANADTSQFFNYASMIIPSNDAFIANGDPTLHNLFDDEGNFIGADFIVAGSNVLDGGTEVNDELAENTAFFSQTEPNTGEDENSVVTTHPGFIEDGRILSEDGTTEGAPAAFNNADFTAEDYQVARISVSLGDRNEESPEPLAEPVTISSILDGEQEVDGGDADASGTSTLTLNETGDGLEYSLTVTGLDFGASGLIEGEAVTEDTTDDVTRIHIHNAPRGENGDVVFSLFDSLAEDDLEIPGSQDEDLTFTPNDDGSVTLAGVWEETDPTNTPLSEFVDEIQSGAEDEDLDLYWNVHTEEFPDGAIRGQLVVNNEEDAPPEPEPLTVTVTVENLAPEAGTFLTPFWVGFHDGEFDTYDRGRPISPGLESLVEDGDTAALSEEFLASGFGTVEGTITGDDAVAGQIAPGETVTATFEIDANADTSQFFNYASMVTPSNDAFIANGDPTARNLFDEEGNFIGADFIFAGSQVLDGGTEVNDELAENTAFFSQTEPNTGETENGVVTTHPGFIEDGRILSEDGTTEGAPAAFNNADFTAENYQMARITVSVVDDPVSISSTLDGEQEVDGGDAEASGTSILTLNETGNGLEYSLTVTGLDFGASGLIEGGAVTEDTSDDVTRIHIHNAPRGENGDVVFSLFDSLTEDDLEIPGNQDEDLTFTPNDDGSVTLAGVWDGTDASSTPLSEFVEEIRAAEAGEDLDLYWNVHTEEFPAGAIRGQLVVEETAPEPETIELYRFRNTAFETGTYVFVGAEERDNILEDPDLNQTFSLDGQQEDGTINPAFVASTVAGEDYIPFYRLSSLENPGTFLFVSTEEYEGIFAENSDQRDKWEQQGFDEAETDIPEFYLYDGSADLGTEFNRFQNSQNNTFLYAGPEETEAIANDPNLANVFNDQGVAFESLA
jgi:hypothetical protein